MAKMKENSVKVYNYVVEHESENITAKDIAAALDLSPRQVNGIITASFQRHREEIDGEKVIVPLMERVDGELEIVDPETEKVKHETTKFIKLTDAGRNFEVEAE